MTQTLSIIMPVYNEKDSLEIIIQKILDVSLPANLTKELIIVDDGSADGSAEILQKYVSHPSVKIFNNERNLGKTAALKKGIAKACGDFILIQDADLEYDPCEYPRLLHPLLENKADVIYGSRFQGNIERMHPVNRLANRFSNMTFNLFFGGHLTDINTCYKLFKKDSLSGITITSENFMFETEITAKFKKKKLRILEVPIRYMARSKNEGKKIDWPKAIQMYWGIIFYRFFDGN